MEIRDYNGIGIWSAEQITSRYLRHCLELEIEPKDITPVETVQQNVKWIYPVMDEIIAGIESGDAACRKYWYRVYRRRCEISFGKILKSNTARALRRSELSYNEKSRIRQRVISMLLNGIVPREFKEYIKLLKRIGFAEFLTEIEDKIDRANGYVMKRYD